MKNKGFTIIESLIAITILVLAVTGATGAIQRGISSYIFSKDQVIAFYLAQEGLEQIRNIRDENGLKNRHWLTGLSVSSADPCFFDSPCIVDPVNTTEATRCFVECPLLKQDEETGFFGYSSESSWQDTIFTREIILQQINENEISVLAIIDWSTGVTSREFRARENILNWQ